jgi:hypothetical protein
MRRMLSATRTNLICRVRERAPSQLSAKTTELPFAESYISALNNPSLGAPSRRPSRGTPATSGCPLLIHI